MSEQKFSIPTKYLRPIQPACSFPDNYSAECNRGEILEALLVVWMSSGFFVILDGHHRFVAAWLQHQDTVPCQVLTVFPENYPNLRGLLVEIPRRVEEYQMWFRRNLVIESMQVPDIQVEEYLRSRAIN